MKRRDKKLSKAFYQEIVLELLTTAIYAYEHTNAKTQGEVTEKVKTIKGAKYCDQEIQWALSEFSYFGIAL